MRQRIRVAVLSTSLIAIRLFALLIVTCVAAPGLHAQVPSVANTGSTMQTHGTDPCGCRNVPGGYPCLGGCQNCMTGVDCKDHCGAEARWNAMRRMPSFNIYGQGDYAGPSRLAHLSEYRLRPNDQLQLFYLITRRQNTGVYKLTPGDEILIESLSDSDLSRGTLESGLQIQPDGTITVRMLGQVQAAGRRHP